MQHTLLLVGKLCSFSTRSHQSYDAPIPLKRIFALVRCVSGSYHIIFQLNLIFKLISDCRRTSMCDHGILEQCNFYGTRYASVSRSQVGRRRRGNLEGAPCLVTACNCEQEGTLFLLNLADKSSPSPAQRAVPWMLAERIAHWGESRTIEAV